VPAPYLFAGKLETFYSIALIFGFALRA